MQDLKHYYTIKINLYYCWYVKTQSKWNALIVPDEISYFYNRVTVLVWSTAFWLDAASHVTSFNQSECIISD